MALQTFEVTYAATLKVPDLGPADLDLEPERVPVQGSVTFTPSIPVLLEDDDTPEDVYLEPETYGLNAAGVLADGAGNPAVALVSPWSADLGVQGWNWVATFNLRGGLTRDAIVIPTSESTPGATVNLTMVAPVSAIGSTPVLRGPKGEAGEPGEQGEQGDPGTTGVDDPGIGALVGNESSFTRAALDAGYVRKNEITASPLPPSSPTVGQVWIKNG